MVRPSLNSAGWFLLFVLCLSAPGLAHEKERSQPPWQSASGWPDRILATLSGDPSTSFAVNWRTNQNATVAIAEIALALPGSRFDLRARTVKGNSEAIALEEFAIADLTLRELHNAGLPVVNYHSVIFKDLLPDTLYAYRVRGEPGKWSAWRQLRTAPEEGPLSFIFFGDAQTGIRSHITRVFDTAAQVAPNARFTLHGGDLVNTAAYDREWAEWFEALGSTAQIKPLLPVAGNHDYINITKARNARIMGGGEITDEKLFVAEKTITPLWRPQFALPVVDALPPALAETVYAVRYSSDLHLFVLDSSGIAFAEQLSWLSRQITSSDARWKVVSMHHPLFSHVGAGEHPEHRRRREALVKTIREVDIDVIVTGHRHSYQRGTIGENVARYNIGDEQSVKTVFVVTASSTKRGQSKEEGWERYAKESEGYFRLSRYADNVPIFAVFDIDGAELRYRAIDATGREYDGFTLRKTDGGKQLTDRESALGPTLNRSNTVRYIPWDDLR